METQQCAQASAEVTRLLRRDWPWNHQPFAIGDAHFNHLVAWARSGAGIIDYWFALRGTSRDSYEKARLIFGHVVAGTAAQLKRTPGAPQ